MSPQQDRPLNDAECDRINAMLSRFHSEYAINNAEEIDGFFAALICSPELAKPSQYLPEIWGGEMADDEAFADRKGAQDFLSLLMRHWNNIARILEKGDVFAPLLFVDEEGTARANDWARGVCAADSAVLYMAAGQANGIASALLARGMPAHTPVLIVENASLPTLRADAMTLHEMQHLPLAEFQGPAVIMLGEAFRPALVANRDGVSLRTAAG